MNEAENDLIREQARRMLTQSSCVERLRNLLETRGTFDRQTWSQIAALGWLGMTIPEARGGLGLTDDATAVIAEEIGRLPVGIPFGPTVYVSAYALAHWAPPETGQQWLEPLIAGDLVGAFAFAEPGEGGLPPNASVELRASGLCGRKVAVVAGAYANFAVVACSEPRSPNTLLACVDLSQPGVRRQIIESFDNSLGYADLDFEDCAVRVLDAPMNAAQQLLDRAALFTAFEQIGGAQSCLETARDYALERRVFGQVIGSFQGIKHKLADMYAAIQVARGAALAALAAPAEGLSLACASARHAAIKAYDFCAQENIQVHGGIGVTWEAAHHLHYRRARCLGLQWGGAPYWRERVVAGVRVLPPSSLP